MYCIFIKKINKSFKEMFSVLKKNCVQQNQFYVVSFYVKVNRSITQFNLGHLINF